MGLFSKFKQVFKKEEKKQEDIEAFDKGLEKTRKEFVSELSILGHKYHKVNDDYFEELEAILIKADIGIRTVTEFLDRLRKRVKDEKIEDTEYLREVIIDELFMIYVNGDSLTDKINIQEDGPTVILMVGVNGVGKTTTIAKIAYRLKNEGKKVLLAAGDTFRAGAVDQLEIWAKKVGVDIVIKKGATDPSSVIFEAIQKAKNEKYDILLCDTAGRLQNKTNLMKELEKMHRVIAREVEGAPQETLLVIDATTGQNGLSQAEAFMEVTNITGVILTKLDGTSKGGIVLAIRDKYNLPIKMVGLGEKMEDLEYFDLEDYIAGLFIDNGDEDGE